MPGPGVMVIVAARELYQGVPISEDDLYAVRMHAAYVPEGAFLSPASVVGRTPTGRILANEIVRFEYLSDPEYGHGPSDVIPDGMRVVEVPSSGTVQQAGTYVDVWVTPESGRPCTVLQAAFVVALDGELLGPERAGSRAGLLVLEQQAAELGVAARQPSFRLTARQEQDISFREADVCSH